MQKTMHDSYKCVQFPPSGMRNTVVVENFPNCQISPGKMQFVSAEKTKELLHCHSYNLLELDEQMKIYFLEMLYFETERVVINLYGNKTDQFFKLTKAKIESV